MPSRREFLIGTGSALAGSVVTGGTVFALTQVGERILRGQGRHRLPEGRKNRRSDAQ